MVIDTNIIIAYLKGDEKIVNQLIQWRKENRSLFLHTIVQAEVLSHTKFTPTSRKITEEFLKRNFLSISFDEEIANLSGKIRAETNLKLPDAGIAATAIMLNVPLVTRNLKDFKKVNDLYIIAI